MTEIVNKTYWIVSVPVNSNREEPYQELNRVTISNGEAAEVHKLELPELRVGTLDSLISLSDELTKYDLFVESVVKKIGRQWLELLGKEKHEEAKFTVKDAPLDKYVVKFRWETSRYPRKPLQDLSDQIYRQCVKLDEELKAKASEYSNMVNIQQQRKKLEAGSLAVRDLTNIINPEDIVETEYLTSVLVVVPKLEFKLWESKYERLATFVVPRSSKLLYADNEYGIFRVILFKKVVDEFKHNAKEFRFVVRKYEPNKMLHPEEQKKFENDLSRLKKSLTRWCSTNFSEAFSAWMHLKCIRCYVESVLRYGLTTKFQAVLILPGKNKESKLRATLNSLYSWLGSSFVSTAEEESTSPGDRFYSYARILQQYPEWCNVFTCILAGLVGVAIGNQI